MGGSRGDGGGARIFGWTQKFGGNLGVSGRTPGFRRETRGFGVTQGLGGTLRFGGDPRASEGIRMSGEGSDTRGGSQGFGVGEGGRIGGEGPTGFGRYPDRWGDQWGWGGGRTTGLGEGVWV